MLQLPMLQFRLSQAKYDRETQRAYVELKSNDPDGDEILTVVVFSFRTICRLSKPKLERERPQRLGK